ncbi:TIGR02281 family clan AA aspartic protease [Pseudaminobacter sp. 19-2017]|uniref:TIGR02281 family clan AA aspartic protease n=1 Tax=Pseudaminobacter soli (ex Zhang et al. 2022) TaxID=2831468 RepID=A0A942DYX2_9HYPH|nr:TIGR02281 family clan AA aspartic protease [Pseudaminobacter soli]MBS3650176.1 TIGR02281 family clan AA aspartic protease [Pseudaminobacter soli]
MLRKTIIFGICVGVSASVPVLYKTNPEAVAALVGSSREQGVGIEPPAEIAKQAATRTSGISGRKVEIKADPRGHYLAEFKINGRPVTALVDTGATLVAMNFSTARRIGIKISPSDLTGSVNTANGKTRAATVELGRVDIGRISVENVPAMVLEDKALDVVLIGMAFLSRLKKFEVSEGNLLLAQ